MISLHDLSDEFAAPAVLTRRSQPLSGAKSFFSRWLTVTMAAREAHATRVVNSYLAHHDLSSHRGQTVSEIKSRP
jgi:hypothetical protein